MKIRYVAGPGQVRDVELASYLKPTNRGSNQGSIEQLEAEVETLKESFGNLMAMLVEREAIKLEDAEQIAGIHETYREYRYKNRILIG